MSKLPITSEELAEAKQLYEAATPGPWEKVLKRTLLSSGSVFQTLAEYDENVEANAKFIAAARALVPRLVAEVERLRDLSSCELCRDTAGLCSAHQPLTGQRDAMLKQRDEARAELEAWRETGAMESRNKDFYRCNQLSLQAAIRKAMNELGVPGPGYPANVDNAYQLLADVLKHRGIVDGNAVHSDDCTGDPCRCST